MALTSQQLIALACQTARAPGYTSQAGQFLNQILSDLCETYDFDAASAAYAFTLNPAATKTVAGSTIFGGPTALPADFLRCKGDRALTFWVGGTPYQPKRIELDDFDQQVQVTGQQAYPSLFVINMSIYDETADAMSGAELYLWIPPSGAFPAQLRYYRQMPDIATPETSNTVPWFANQEYLRLKLEAKLMGLTRDPHAAAWDERAEKQLTKYLKLKDDPEGRAKVVRLDRRMYGSGDYKRLPNTKKTGW